MLSSDITNSGENVYLFLCITDDHDVQAFLTHSLIPPENVATGTQQVSDDDRLKFEQEFDEYYQKLQKAKEE